MKPKPASVSTAASALTSASARARARSSSLEEPAGLREAWQARASQRAPERTQAQAASRAAEADAALFRHAIGAVAPLHAPARAALQRTPPAPTPWQTQRDEKAVLHEAISDDFDPEAVLDADDSLSYHRAGVRDEVVRKLRRGAWTVQAQLDLHGMRRDEARAALQDFLREAGKRQLRCVRIIHGKGLGSAGGEPVLKGRVRAWLAQKENVIAFCQARPHDGGAGAVLVLLQQKTSRPS